MFHIYNYFIIGNRSKKNTDMLWRQKTHQEQNKLFHSSIKRGVVRWGDMLRRVSLNIGVERIT